MADNWWDKFTTGVGDILAGPAQPWGTLIPGLPQPTSYERSAQIGNTLLSLGGALAAGARQRLPIGESIATGWQNVQQQGAERQQRQLQGLMIGSKLTEAQRAAQRRSELEKAYQNPELLGKLGPYAPLLKYMPEDKAAELIGKFAMSDIDRQENESIFRRAMGMGSGTSGTGPAVTPPAGGGTPSEAGPYPQDYYNNIGNLIAGKTGWEGKGSPFAHPALKGMQFETFADPAAGVRAAYNNVLYHVRNSGVRTFDDLGVVLLGGKVGQGHITPDRPDGGKDNSQAWANAVASYAGLKSGDPLPINDPQAMAKVMAGINKIEHGRLTVPPEAYLAGVTGQRTAPGQTAGAAPQGAPQIPAGAPSPVTPVQATPPAGGPPQAPGTAQAPVPLQSVAPGIPPQAMAFATAMARKDPAAAANFLKQYMGPEAANRELIYDQRSGQWVVNRPLIEAKTDIARAGAPPAAEAEALKRNAEDAAKVASEVQAAGLKSRTAKANAQQLGALLEGMSTGRFTQTTQDIKRMAKGIGIDLDKMGVTDNVGRLEAASALVNAMALQLRDPSSGAGMPGAMSDADRSFLTGMVPGLETTPEGRQLMLSYMLRLHEHNIGLAKVVSDYRRSGKWASDPQGIHVAMQDYADNNPIFRQEDIDAVAKARGATPVPTNPPPEPTASQGPPAITGREDYDRLPPGTQYRDPQGNIRTKR